jgi:hypothetical protein
MSSSTNYRDPFFAKLVDFSQKATQSKPAIDWRRWWIRHSDRHLFVPEEEHHATTDSAAPLAPLRERDTAALAALFEGEDVEDIQSDIRDYLALIYPAPCWEDDPFEFLKGYL